MLFGASGGNYISSERLTIGPQITVRGSSGLFNMNGGTLVNQGTISADGSGGATGGTIANLSRHVHQPRDLASQQWRESERQGPDEQLGDR